MRHRPWPFLLAAFFVTQLSAQPAAIPDAETNYAPTSQRITAIHAAAQRDGWAPHVAPLRHAAFRAYEAEKLQAAEAWYHVYRWAALFAQNEAEFVTRWINAVNTAHVAHGNMATRFQTPSQPIALQASPELQSWLIGNTAFSAEFFALLSPVDFLPRVLAILEHLRRGDPARFNTYARLALAIAVVYDVPPPPHWPHGQVAPEALVRQLPAPADAFNWWIRQEKLGRTYHKLSRLGADELKFVVDAAAPFSELEWAQAAADLPLNQLARAYTMVRYRRERASATGLMWPGRSYKLPEILGTGGICADQAYFATQVGKARGVPTLLIYGAGNDGRHAWFGFLDGNRTWQLDAGRYAEQQFVTGFARDPQTWREFSDHELKFLRERFRELPSFRQSRVHASFAQEYLALGKAPLAGAAARKAVNYERRNQAGWETLISAARQEARDARTIETLLREASLAFQNYPDLEAHYVNRVAESLRARGQTSAAEEEERRIARKNKSTRGDLSVQQAREILRRAITEKTLPEQIRVYNSVVDTHGRGAGIAFFDQVVQPFVEHLVQLNQQPEARRALERARQALKIESGSQFESELEALAKRLAAK